MVCQVECESLRRSVYYQYCSRSLFFCIASFDLRSVPCSAGASQVLCCVNGVAFVSNVSVYALSVMLPVVAALLQQDEAFTTCTHLTRLVLSHSYQGMLIGPVSASTTTGQHSVRVCDTHSPHTGTNMDSVLRANAADVQHHQ